MEYAMETECKEIRELELDLDDDKQVYCETTIKLKAADNNVNSQQQQQILGNCNKKGTMEKKFKRKPNIFLIVYNLIGIKEKRSTKENGTLILLGIMLLLFLISLTGFFVMWFTEYYNNSMLDNIILSKNSETAEQWMNPNPKYDTLLKVHIFNYTNIDRYLAGLDDKIHVQDVGPLTYQEHTIKVNVSFNQNHTVTFRDRRSYKFLPEKSTFDPNARVIVPNVPLLSADLKVDKLSFIVRRPTIWLIRSFKQKVFKSLTAHEYIWGYRDKIVRLNIGTGKTHFGLLMNRNGTSVDSVQINTGTDDIRKFSTITQFNGMPKLDYWNDDKCDSIDGSDASMFPPHMLENRQVLNVFLQVLCRKVPLHFESEVKILDNKIDALRYRTPLNVFSHPDENEENSCYCRNTEVCLPTGVINATKCYNDAPIYPSFPHFFSGDPVLYEPFEGIKPEAELHQTYADIHPRFAFPMSGASRIQINIAVHNGELTSDQFNGRLQKGFILPLIWIEITSGDFTEDTIDKLYVSTFGLDAIQYALKYGTLLICITSFSLIVGVFYTLSKKTDEYKVEHEKDSKLTAGNVEIEVSNIIQLPESSGTQTLSLAT